MKIWKKIEITIVFIFSIGNENSQANYGEFGKNQQLTNNSLNCLQTLINPLIPMLAMTGLAIVPLLTTFDQNWHYMYSTSTGGKDIANDTHNRTIGSREL